MVSKEKMTRFEDAPIQILDGDRGANYPSQQDFFVAEHCLFLNAGNVTSNGFKFDVTAFITEEKDNSLRKGKLRRSDIVMTTRGTVGNIAFFDMAVPYDNIRINSGMVIIRVDESQIAPQYLYCFLRSSLFKSQVLSLTSGSAVPQLPIKDIKRLLLPLPSLAEQRRIAHILGTLDDKIELNRQLNATLEQLARALFQSWFVDFDPVRAKASGEAPASICRRLGLTPELVALFPAELEDSALGEVPAGWEVSNVYRISQVIYGAPFKSALFNSESIGRPLVRIRDLATQLPTIYTPEEHPKGYLIQPGDLVVGMDGEFKARLWAGPESWMNQRICCFKPKQGFSRAFVHYSIEGPLDFFERTETATTVIHLGKGDIDTFRLIVPSMKLLAAFASVVEPLEQQIVTLSEESRTLAALRDELLPKLLAGESHF